MFILTVFFQNSHVINMFLFVDLQTFVSLELDLQKMIKEGLQVPVFLSMDSRLP